MRNKQIKVTYFNNEKYETIEMLNIDNIEERKYFNCWIDIKDNSFKDYAKDLEDKFKVHPLAIEDIVDGSKRTKLERFDNFEFIILHPIKLEDSVKKLIHYDDIYVILKDKLIITLSNSEVDIFYDLINNLYINKVNIDNTTNKLNFAIMEKLVDNYYDNFGVLEEEVDKLDIRLIKDYKYDIIDELYLLRRNMIYMNKYITPIKSIIKYIYEAGENNRREEGKYYYRDLNDDIETITENIEVYKDLTTTIIDTINNRVGEKTNQITTVLTVWSTIFLPITFITGVFGMNFKHMDSLTWKYAYPIFWLISIIIVLIMVLFFRRKKWL
ncbi:magnesium transporter CorA family protein [Miniphocaeibacter massiliensis]|uniref:magnesium transporter CorA family protein n=1 Tax=Miniphocaeibacter massiliensis TaxID=2041841 RepID=UPI000C1BDBD1|nr:magnesium transporter CorA family protein [Miniphocaeibacter massiliensis]